MIASSERLWWLNNAYRKHLTEAEKCLGLLETLLTTRSPGDENTVLLHTLQTLRQQLMRLTEDHRVWRYTYYYQSPFHKRMVASERDVYRALLHFERMRLRHERALVDLVGVLHTLPQPAPALTNVVSGDLWHHATEAVEALRGFVMRRTQD
jgi:hypothetical protein